MVAVVATISERWLSGCRLKKYPNTNSNYDTLLLTFNSLSRLHTSVFSWGHYPGSLGCLQHLVQFLAGKGHGEGSKKKGWKWNCTNRNKTAQSNLRAGCIPTLATENRTRLLCVLSVQCPLQIISITKPYIPPQCHIPLVRYIAIPFPQKICRYPWGSGLTPNTPFFRPT